MRNWQRKLRSKGTFAFELEQWYNKIIIFNKKIKWKKTKNFTHLKKSDRDEIEILLNKKHPLRDIGTALNRSVSVIFYEIKNNSVNGKYDSIKAQYKAHAKRRHASFRGKKIIANEKLREFVEEKLLEGRSSESISGRIIHKEKNLPNLSKDTIYDYLRSPYGKVIKLKLEKKKRRLRRKNKVKLDGRIFIDNRPKIANKRGRVGDFEADFIVSGKSGKGVLLTAIDRKTRVSFLEIIRDVSIDEVHSAMQW